MKKSTVVAGIMLICTFLFITSYGNKKIVYEKQIIHKSPIDAIEDFIDFYNVYEEAYTDKGINMVRTNEYNESLSRRYRLLMEDNYFSNNSMVGYYISGGSNSDIPTFKEYTINELEGSERERFQSDHNTSYANIPNYIEVKDKRYFKVEGLGTYRKAVNKIDMNNNMEDGELNLEDITLYIAVIDEGEGYVVDYYKRKYLN